MVRQRTTQSTGQLDAIVRRDDALISSVFRRDLDTSSFGHIGFIGQGSSERLRGFIGDIRHNHGAVTPITDRVGALFAVDVANRGVEELAKTDNDRLSFRVLMAPDVVEFFREELSRTSQVRVEAEIPFNIGFDHYMILYLAYNAETRPIDSGPAPRSGSTEHRSEGGLFQTTVGIVNGINTPSAITLTQQNTEQAISLLRNTFGYDHETAQAVMTSPNNVVSVALRQDEVVGISVAERRTLNIGNGRSVQIAELTDGTVHSDYKGNGLYYKISTELIAYLSRLPQMDLIYGESNAQNSSLMDTTARQGRRFGGILYSNTEINGNMRNFVVTYLTPRDFDTVRTLQR